MQKQKGFWLNFLLLFKTHQRCTLEKSQHNLQWDFLVYNQLVWHKICSTNPRLISSVMHLLGVECGFSSYINLQDDCCRLPLNHVSFLQAADTLVLQGVCIIRMYKKKGGDAPKLAAASVFKIPCSLNIGWVKQTLIPPTTSLPTVIYPQWTLCEMIMGVLRVMSLWCGFLLSALPYSLSSQLLVWMWMRGAGRHLEWNETHLHISRRFSQLLPYLSFFFSPVIWITVKKKKKNNY